MARPRHAMRVHPLRSKGVVVGVPVAAAVAFGAHSVLGVTPLSEQQDAPVTASAAPSAAPVQSYGLAATPPPATLDLLSAPAEHTSGTAAGTAKGSTSSVGRSTTTPIVADRGAAPTQVVPIAAAPAPAPSMMSFSGGAGGGAHQHAQSAADEQAEPQHEAAPQQQAAESDGGSQQSGGGSLLGLDLGVAKVSVLSFGQ
jgi:hypothetical protein